MTIDSHQHFWVVGKFDYPWLTPKLGVLYRDYLPADLAPLLKRAGFDRTILVQASPSVAETNWLLDLAAQHEFIAGVVGWLDFEAPDFERQLERYRQKPKFVGIRPAIEFLGDDNWLTRPGVIESFRVLEAADFPFDFIIWPRHLPVVLKALAQVPRLRCVVDHLAKSDGSPAWRDGMREIAHFANAHCKLSGLPTTDRATAQPWVDHVLECFGPDRVMFGSDWPVSLQVGNYEQSITQIRDLAATVPEAKLFGDNAAKFYKLPSP